MNSRRLIHEIRAARPKLAARADKGSRPAAIQLFCLECSGGALLTATSCENNGCPLWAHAGSRWTATRSKALANRAS